MFTERLKTIGTAIVFLNENCCLCICFTELYYTRKELRRCVRRLGTIIQSIFCTQSGAAIRLNLWKWSGESRYPGVLPPLLENFCPAFSPEPTDSPWVSEDVSNLSGRKTEPSFLFGSPVPQSIESALLLQYFSFKFRKAF